MKIRKIAAIMILVFSSFAASNVAPSKTELEAMYSKAFRAFEGNSFSDALKQLDEIDARQPEVAESHNLRGVILMRQGNYDEADAALQEAVRIDPKFWNARFNLAEIPFLKKSWTEARDRFQKLLSSNVADLAGDAAELIQYKILLTYLLEGNQSMVDSIVAKFKLSPETPAVPYSNAAIAFQHKNGDEARDWIATAQKDFSPQSNRLFAESLYEVGWMPKPAGQARASMTVTSAADRTEKTKEFARSRFEQAQQALQQHDFENARKYVEESDAADPNQAATSNLRGEILMEQKDYAGAEAAFKKALKINPKFNEAQYNLAQIPFKQKDYAAARERFDALVKQTPGGDKNQAAQILKYKIFMTYLLEGKDSRAQKLMEQFQFTGDTPALYYAQAAWEFKHNNPDKASDWVTSAKRIYSPALNGVFADAFYDLGWMQSPTVAAGPAPAAEAATVMSAQTESSPAIEPSPIPGTRLASNKQAPATETAPGTKPETVAAASPNGRLALSLSDGIVPATAAPSASVSPAGSEQLSALPAATQSPVVETTPAMAEASPNASVTALASPGETAVIAQSSPATQASAPPIPSPATTLAPTHVATQPAPAPTVAATTSRQTLIIVGLLIGAAFFMAAAITMFRRRGGEELPLFGQPASANGPTLSSAPFSAPEANASATKNFSGGPRQVSLQLKAAEPSIHRGVLPSGRIGRGNGAVAPITTTPLEPAIHRGPEPAVAYREPERAVEEEIAESVGPVFEESECVGPVVEQQPEPGLAAVPQIAQPQPGMTEPTVTPWVESSPVEWVGEPVAAPEIQPEPVEALAEPAAAPSNERLFEPVAQGQPVPYQTPVWPEITPVEPAVDTPLFETNVIESSQPITPQMQTTISEIMPEPIQIPTVRPTGMPSPAMPAPVPQQAGPLQTAVQLTFTFEIASMQLTPTFKMGALQVRPTSKVVSMRLAPSQQPQPGMNLQVTFEIAKIQPASGALGSIRLTPSQQQRPTPTGSPSFTVAGLQLVPSFESAPVQLTPSGQGASVLVTAPFQISTVEFSPSFEIASIALSSNSKHVLVQLPGPAPAAGEGAPMFEIANLQLTGNGDIGMMQLNLLQAGRR
jgi:tetratricopeptide (TPR) repeat protein